MKKLLLLALRPEVTYVKSSLFSLLFSEENEACRV